jgi:hypothetical protein
MRCNQASGKCLLRYPIKSKPVIYFSAGKATGYAWQKDLPDDPLLKKATETTAESIPSFYQ